MADKERYVEDALRIMAVDRNGDDDTYFEVLSRYNPRVLNENEDLRDLLAGFLAISTYLATSLGRVLGMTFEEVVDGMLLDLVREGQS